MTKSIAAAAAITAVIALFAWLPFRKLPPHREPAAATNLAVTSKQDEAQTGFDLLRQLQGVEIIGPRFRQNDKDGKPILEVIGQSILNDADSNSVRIHDVTATLFQAGKPAAHFRAKQVQVSYDKGNERLVFTGGVHIESKLNRAKLDAPRVDYNVNARRLAATNGIRFAKDNLHINSGALVADLGLEVLTMSGGVHGYFETRHRL